MVTKVKGGVLDESALSGKNMTGDIAFDTTTLKIDSSNNRVGVGTASPAALLHLSGDSDNGDEACQIVLNDEDSSAGSRVPSIQFKGNNTNIGRIRGTDTQGIIMSGSSAQGDDLVVQAGYVGIGTTSPSAPLEINANLERQLELVRTTTTTGAVYQRLTNDGGNYYIGADSSAGDRLAIGGQAYALTLTTESARPIVFATTNTTRMTIDSSGNVGIGTASPAQKLHVSGEVKATSADITDTSGNTSIGYGALNNLTSGDSNVAVGYESLEDVTDGTHNVSVGYRTAMNITGGDYNTAVGNYALTTLTTQSYNTAVGYYALGGATTGQQNTGVGYYSLPVMTTALYNTAIGLQSGRDCTTGSDNLFLGYRAGDGPSPSGSVTTQSNYIVVGNNSSTNAYIKIDWTVTSDKRDKTDIEPLTMGLDLVNKLNPVTYRWDMRSDYEDNKPDGTHKKEKLSGGLLAQDVEVLEREYGYKVEDKTSILTDKNADGNYGLTYSKFVPVLINAVKELSAQVEELKAKVESK